MVYYDGNLEYYMYMFCSITDAYTASGKTIITFLYYRVYLCIHTPTLDIYNYLIVITALSKTMTTFLYYSMHLYILH